MLVISEQIDTNITTYVPSFSTQSLDKVILPMGLHSWESSEGGVKSKEVLLLLLLT